MDGLAGEALSTHCTSPLELDQIPLSCYSESVGLLTI